MDEKLIEENNNLISNTKEIETESTPLGNVNAKLKTFKITPQELTDIVNKYKERDENFQDINYFKENNGVKHILKSLDTDEVKGIITLEGREEHFGSNKVFRPPLPKFIDFVIEGISDKMIIILICCSIVEIFISMIYHIKDNDNDNLDWIDGISIIIAVIVVVSVGSFTNYRKEMKFHELNNIQNGKTTYNIIRSGIPKEVISDDILVGDLVKINYGEILPADMILINGNGLKIDESSLTGESNSVSKKPFEQCLEEFEKGNSKPSSNILLSGTNVIEGNGNAIVIAIGEHSQKGIIRGTIDNAQENNKTPLEIKLNKIADLIGYFGLGSAVITLIVSVIQMIVRYIKNKKFNFGDMVKKILNIIILCVSIIVVAIPEGLPLAVTLSLAFSIKKLMDNNNLVRKMHACETMGGANVICTDKTGTLTQNLMFATRLITSNQRIEIPQTIEIDDISVKKKGQNIDINKKIREEHSKIIENEEYWDCIYNAIALNVNCIIKKLETPDDNGDMEICDSNNKTDKGFIEFLYQFKSPISSKIDLFLSNKENYKISPFDSQRKRMTTYIKNEKFPTGYRLFTKGGAENAMIYSNRYINKDTGKIASLNEEIKKFVNKEIDSMNKEMMRTLYICYKDITQEEYENCNSADENGLFLDQKDLIFIGIFGLKDSLRNGVKLAVEKCHQGGVSVIMVTGDNIITAIAIAKECQIIQENIDINNLSDKEIEMNPNEINNPTKKEEHIQQLLKNQPYAITGNSFYNIIGGIYCQICQKDTHLCQCPKSEAEAREIAKHSKDKTKKPIKKDTIKNMANFITISKNLLVMARSQPIHKYALVLGLKSMGSVVAVTGDGTNDAPALSKSDVGFSMNDGTDIAKEASDIIIMDNNFSSIVIAMIYGRSIYENIRKFLQFQLTVNFCACILVFLCSCIGNETPLNSIQMLWVNLIMDSLGSLALATEPPYDELLDRKPTNKNESIINGLMWKHIILQSICEIIILLILYFDAPKFFPEYKDEPKAFALLLKECFGQLPGGGREVTNKILYGNKDKWSNKIYFNTSLSKDMIKKCNQSMVDDELKYEEFTLFDAYNYNQDANGGTTHMTLIFDVFVCYTLFNQLNCRIIDDSLNIFKRIDKGYMFCIVSLSELLIQIMISQLGYNAFHCVHHGLSFVQWIYCFLFSMTTMIFNIIIKHLPLEKFIEPLIKSAEDLVKETGKVNLDINEVTKDGILLE